MFYLTYNSVIFRMTKSQYQMTSFQFYNTRAKKSTTDLFLIIITFSSISLMVDITSGKSLAII